MMAFRNLIKRDYDMSDIIQGCRLKKEKFQELLYKNLAPKILTLCRRYETRDFDAYDILQDTFIAVFEHFDQYDDSKASVETWIKRIAVNTALKKIRQQKQHFVEIDTLDYELHEWDDNDDENSRFNHLTEEQIIAEIQKLPVGYRTVFNMFVIDGFSHKDIAAELGITETTSKTQFFKAKKMLKGQILSKIGEYEPKMSFVKG